MSRKKGGGRDTRNNDVLKSRDKAVNKMTKDGLVEHNLTTDEEKRISKRDKRFDLRNNPVDVQADDVAADMPQDIYNAMFPQGSGEGNVINFAEASQNLTNQADSYSLSQLGTKQKGDNIIDIADADAAKRSAAKKRQRQAYSRSSGNNTSAPPPQLAEIYDFPKPLDDNSASENTEPSKPITPDAEHEPRGAIRHKSKKTVPLSEHRLSNLRQAPKPGKFTVAPTVDEPGRHVDVDAHGKAEPLKHRKNQQPEHTEQPLDADEALHGDATDDTAPHEYGPTNQPGSPADSTKGKQLRHQRKDANIDHDSDGSKLELPDTVPPHDDSNGETSSDVAEPQPPARRRGLQPESDKPKPSPKTIKLEHRAEKASDKLDKAKSNLPTKHKIGIERTFDEDTGKSKTRLKFDSEVKTQRDHLKGPVPLRPVKFAANAAITKAHMKIYQAEHENVGTQAAHKVELAGESVVRSALRHRKLAPYKKVAKLERKLAGRSAKLSYQRALRENPQMKKNPIARFWQKRKLKRKHIKAAQQAQKTAAKAKKAGSIMTRAMRTLAMLIKKNPKVIIIVIVLFVLINIVSSLIGALSGLGSGGVGAVFATTYLSEESEIEAASLAYSRWEMDLRMAILNVGETHPGFDEYRFNTGEISHNPFELMAYLTATRVIFTFAEIESDLLALFDEQYQLSFTPSVEVRFRDSGEVDAEGNPIYELFDWHVMTVTLTAQNFNEVVWNRMTPTSACITTCSCRRRGNGRLSAARLTFLGSTLSQAATVTESTQSQDSATCTAALT